MRRSGQYGDAGVNPMMAAQMQQMSAQRMQYNSGVGNFSGHADEEHQYISSKAERQWQWDMDGPKGAKPMSPNMYKEGQGSDSSRSAYQGQRPDSKIGLEKQMIRDPRDSKEVGYDESNHPQTFEGLEEKFLEDIMKLTKEQEEAEDKENTRHRERLSEINTQYQEKLVTVRAQQASLRDEFLRKESQVRHKQYQQASISNYHPNEAYGYGSAASAAAAAGHGDPHQAFGRGNIDPYREGPEFGGAARSRDFDPRGQYPGGRAYNSGGRYY
ncbi:uncharacterized protein LOC110100787 isoform X1 [Dendrobium catenatum]|uniref:Uncharacterized protein n=2 Tax=Dendrobium catenatum TaxID=906689 RepID=A0A2I0VAJ5_9ASPA|nr:uncharacterized protein LOC110100787 isoform X1 [Dendrobium catenatum]XP_028548195.1 uncharacterized protein LOC110100787 isoform X1 [Dendrobium catenatum]XP_028548196.1 uncharacterized protein LOC110100787 isoform X1 [Dendrobium catenatum]PKU60423.1 hypothetical protein MA16_Dca026131 [Dendrobium catenatum]